MVDPNAIAHGLQSARTAYQIVRGIASADQLVGEAQLKMRIAELADLLMQAQEGLLAAQDELRRIRAELYRITQAKKGKEPQGPPTRHGGLYFLHRGDEEVGPYCPRCYSHKGRFTRIHEAIGGTRDESATYYCPECGLLDGMV